MKCIIFAFALAACSAPATTSTPTSSIPTSTTTIDAGAPLADATTLTQPGCKRVRQTHVSRCSGVPPHPGESNTRPVTACDECDTDAECTAKPGGSCQQRGDSMCTGPRRNVCLYPDPACGGGICPERRLAPPASVRPRS